MRAIENYVSELAAKSNEHLSKEYHLGDFRFTNFQSINFYLIDRALNLNRNLFIQSFDKELPSLSQFPCVLAVATSLFFKNYCDDITEYRVGDILQKDGIRYEYVKRNENGTHFLRNQIGIFPEVSSKNLKKYIITNADLSNRKVRTRFDDYRNLFQLLYKEKYVPSKFKYKSVIILEKKDFDEELANQKNTEIDIRKAVPMRWIAKSGKESWNHIPIEPMIYCVPDYDTFEEHILDKGQEIESLIIIGKNKYKGNVLSKVKRALREGTIPNCIILGNEELSDEYGMFLKWRWTYEEFAFLENQTMGKILPYRLRFNDYESAINDFINHLSEVEQEFDIRLSSLKTLRRFLYPIVLSQENDSRNINQIEYVNHLISNASSDAIVENLHNQNIDPTETLQNTENHIRGIFECFGNEKFIALNQIKALDVIIVPEPLLANWKDEYSSNSKILSFKEFLKKQVSYTKPKRVVLFSLFGNGCHPEKLVETCLNSPHRFYVLCYSEEAQLLKSLKNKYENEKINELKSKDRQNISTLKFELILKEVQVSDLIEELHNKSQGRFKDYHYEDTLLVNYQIDFHENGETIVSDGSKTILLKSNGNWIKSKVSNLRSNDIVIIYNNLSKEKLFEIASQEDEKGRFKVVDSHSQIWKESLLKHFEKKSEANPFYSELDLLNDLQKRGLVISNAMTIKKWLNKKDKERFPSSFKSLLAIKNTINCETLNASFESIKKSKKFYRGIMISLGRDLSDDVMEYISSGGTVVGTVLSKFTAEEIKIFVEQAAPQRTIKNISITSEDETN